MKITKNIKDSVRKALAGIESDFIRYHEIKIWSLENKEKDTYTIRTIAARYPNRIAESRIKKSTGELNSYGLTKELLRSFENKKWLITWGKGDTTYFVLAPARDNTFAKNFFKNIGVTYKDNDKSIYWIQSAVSRFTISNTRAKYDEMDGIDVQIVLREKNRVVTGKKETIAGYGISAFLNCNFHTYEKSLYDLLHEVPEDYMIKDSEFSFEHTRISFIHKDGNYGFVYDSREDGNSSIHLKGAVYCGNKAIFVNDKKNKHDSSYSPRTFMKEFVVTNLKEIKDFYENFISLTKSDSNNREAFFCNLANSEKAKENSLKRGAESLLGYASELAEKGEEGFEEAMDIILSRITSGQEDKVGTFMGEMLKSYLPGFKLKNINRNKKKGEADYGII